MARRKTTPPSAEPFVVVVRFPSSSKEYHYLCADPSVRQGSNVIANGTRVGVVRTAALTANSPASKYVQSDVEADKKERRTEIATRLAVLERQETRLAAWSKLKSSEAKRLVAELKELCK